MLSPAFVLLMEGMIMRTGGTFLNLIPTSIPSPTLTLDAAAVIHSLIGINDRNSARNIIIATIIINVSNTGSIIFSFNNFVIFQAIGAPRLFSALPRV
jgi:hypothetical protein